VVGLNLNLAFLRGDQPINATVAAEDLYGLHAVLAVGYDDVERLVTIKNSWGADWANGGYAQVTYGYMDRYGIEMLVLAD
jgi:C1A family cysteine protease